MDLDQRRPSASAPLAEMQHFLVIHPAVATADQVDDRRLGTHRAEVKPTGEQVREPVADIEAGELRHDRTGAVLEHHAAQGEPGQEVPRYLADREVPAEDAIREARDRPRQQQAAGWSDGQRGKQPCHECDRPETGDEYDVRDSAAHQNGCPTAKWNTKRSGFPLGV